MTPQLVPTSRLARLSLRMQSDERLAELVRHCARVLGDADADEAVQEALLKSHRALAAGTQVQSLGPWLHAIAHNSVLAILAGRRVGAEYSDDDASIDA